jgi:hypothetical protein
MEQDALSGVVGAADGAISKEHILHGKIPHANRNLAAALCFNLSVCQAQMNQFEHALTSSRFALLLCHGTCALTLCVHIQSNRATLHNAERALYSFSRLQQASSF